MRTVPLLLSLLSLSCTAVEAVQTFDADVSGYHHPFELSGRQNDKEVLVQVFVRPAAMAYRIYEDGVHKYTVYREDNLCYRAYPGAKVARAVPCALFDEWHGQVMRQVVPRPPEPTKPDA